MANEGSTIALILAAGKSSRFGTPKALIPVDGVPLIQRLITTYTACCRSVWVVTGFEADEVGRIPRALGAVLVHNPHFESGVRSSIMTGMAAVSENERDYMGVLISPVDLPLSDRAVPESLIAAGREEGVLMAIPTFEGDNGYPIWFSKRVISILATESPATDEDEEIRRALHSVPRGIARFTPPEAAKAWIRYVPTDNRDVVANFNSPEMFDRWSSSRVKKQ